MSLGADARAQGRTKDNCQFACEADRDGMPLRMTDGRPILQANGIQTQSESHVGLLPEAGRMVSDGVTHLRLMPQAVDMVAVAVAFRSVLDGRQDVTGAEEALRNACGDPPFSYGFYHDKAECRRNVLAASA